VEETYQFLSSLDENSRVVDGLFSLNADHVSGSESGDGVASIQGIIAIVGFVYLKKNNMQRTVEIIYVRTTASPK
jgi:tRNA A58 N-methylase Trm61